MDGRYRSLNIRQWRALRGFARRAQSTRHGAMVAQEIERMVRQAHQRLTVTASRELLPALPGMENRLYTLFAD